MENEIGKRILELRTKHGLTQAQLASRVSVSFQAISKWEKGKTLPDVNTLPAISNVFGVSIDYLVTGKEFEKTNETNGQWVVVYVNEMIAPNMLTPYAGKQLLKTVEGYDVEYVKECIDIAYQTYVRSQDPLEKKKQIVMMMRKLGGVLYNESLDPVQKNINKMIRALASRTGSHNKIATNSLKKSINSLLAFVCPEDASDNDKLKALNKFNEMFFVPSTSLWDCKYRIDDYIALERKKRSEAERRAQMEEYLNYLKKRANEGFFVLDTGWPSCVVQHLSDANEMIKVKDTAGLGHALYNATSEAVRLMINALPEGERPALEENAELKNFAGNLYGWFGRRIGKRDARYIEAVCDRSAFSATTLPWRDWLDYQAFINRLYIKYKALV